MKSNSNHHLSLLFTMKFATLLSIFVLVQMVLLCNAEESIEEQNVSAYFTQLLSDFRSEMPEGIPELGLPIMDPYSEPGRTVSWEDRDFFGFLHSAGEATSESGVMRGMSAFVIKNITTVLRTPDHHAYPGASLYFWIDFPAYNNTGNYDTLGEMPYSLGTNMVVIGSGQYSVAAATEYPDGSPFPWDGSSHIMDMSPWLNVDEEDGSLWIQNVHGYFRHYDNRTSTVDGLRPQSPLIPITPRVEEILNTYGLDYMVPDIDQSGRNTMYAALQSYIEWTLEGHNWDDLINGRLVRK